MERWAIEAHDLCKRFGDFVAVDGVSLSIPHGGVFGLLGPNGAGKSTRIKMLTTLAAPTSGSARVAGYDVLTQAGQVRHRIGYVPQQQSADPDLTGFENCVSRYGPATVSRRRCWTLPRDGDRRALDRFHRCNAILRMPFSTAAVTCSELISTGRFNVRENDLLLSSWKWYFLPFCFSVWIFPMTVRM